uniref:Uncharacterized protein n=1 Tax=Glossina pallidipes TaxID=7398 RepID=A0A1A9ZRG7_GLOPL
MNLINASYVRNEYNTTLTATTRKTIAAAAAAAAYIAVVAFTSANGTDFMPINRIMDELRPSEKLACDYKCYVMLKLLKMLNLLKTFENKQMERAINVHHNLVLNFISPHLSRLMLSQLNENI